MASNKDVVITETSRWKQMWSWWRAKLNIALQSPWYASYLLRHFYRLMQALRPSQQLVASTVTGATLLVGSIAMNPAPAQAATITVNSTADTAVGGDGQCTLREALTNANDATSTDQSGGDCLAGTGGGSDTIDLTGVSGTITLTSDLPQITNNNEDIVLNGPGAANLTIDGVSQTFRTIHGQTTNIDVTADGLTIIGSRVFGIYASYNVTVTNSIISGNKFVGVYAGISATIINSTISGNTGRGVSTNYHSIVTNSTISFNTTDGVYAHGNVILTNNSIISGNGRDGVHSLSTSIVTNSTISGNNGNGVFAKYGDAIITNSTISGNGGNGVFVYYRNLSLVNSTITGNTGKGVFALDDDSSGAVITLKNSLIVGNTAIDVDCTNNSPGVTTLTTNGKNLISNSAGCAALAGEVTAIPIASIISPLANNGGSTQTHALVAGSPAIDKGNNADSPGATDQRGTGFARIANATIDIGAFEFQVKTAVGGVAELITPQAVSPVTTMGVMASMSALLMGAGAWLMRR